MELLERVSPWLMQADAAYIYGFVAIYAVLEVLFPPFPGDVLVVFAGYLAGRRGMSIGGIIAAAVAGTVCAGYGAYALGRYGREILLRRRFLQKFLPPGEMKRAEGWFRRYGKWILLVSRFLPGIRSPLVVVAGMADTPAAQTMLMLTLSAIGNVTLMVAGGRALGASWSRVLVGLGWAGWILLAVMLLSAAAGWLILRRRRSGENGQR